MRPYRFFPFLLIGVAIVLLVTALRNPLAARRASALAPPAELHRLVDAAPDPEAAAAFAQALARLGEPGREWLQAGIWLRSHVPGLEYEGQGCYWKAPGGRYRVEARTRGERGTSAAYVAVSDGHDRWQATRAGSGGYRDVRRARAGGATPRGLLVAGVDPLLRSLQGQLEWVRREGDGADVVITGTWKPAVRRTLAPPDEPWPASLPRACRVALRDGWPRRVEWWGPAAEGGEDRLLIEVEFRDPVWGRAWSEEECARLFAFDPGQAPVLDLTPDKAAMTK